MAPPAGSYAGSISQGTSTTDDNISLYVSPDSTHLQDVTINGVFLACAPSTPSSKPSPDLNFFIPSIVINSDGSFSGQATVTAVLGNAPVHVTYRLSGHFHGRNSQDNERIAGSVREDLTYDGTSTSCTSNTHSWSATHA